MSKNSELRSVIETTAVVIGSFIAAVVLIVLLTKDYSSGEVQAPEKVVDASNLLNTKFRLPESTAWILWTLSPEAIKFLRVSIIGKPAPTLVS